MATEALLVDAEALAPMLSLSVRTIRVLQEQGIPHTRVGRRVLFDPLAARNWLMHRAGAAPRSDAPARGRPRRQVP